jgi:hypothetical protein
MESGRSEAMGDSSYRLTFDQGKKNEIHATPQL